MQTFLFLEGGGAASNLTCHQKHLVHNYSTHQIHVNLMGVDVCVCVGACFKHFSGVRGGFGGWKV